MATNLASTNSLNNYLTSTGQDSSLRNRRKLFKESGLNQTFGDYTGSSAQNNALYRSLSQSNRAAPIDLGRGFSIEAARAASQPKKTPTGTTGVGPSGTDAVGGGLQMLPNVSGYGSIPGYPTGNLSEADRERAATLFSLNRPEEAQAILDKANAPAQGQTPAASPAQTPASTQGGPLPLGAALGAAGISFAASSAQGQPPVQTPAQTPAATGGAAPAQQTPQQVDPLATMTVEEAEALIRAQQAREQFPTPNFTLDAEGNVVREGTTATTGEIDPNSEEGQAAFDDALDGYESDAVKDIEELASADAAILKGQKEAAQKDVERKIERIMAQTTGSPLDFLTIKDLEEGLMQSELQIDRRLSRLTLDSNQRMRKAVLTEVANLINEAKADNEQAVEQLNKAGYAVVGDKLIPTTAGRTVSLAERREVRLAETPDAYYTVDERGTVTALNKATGQTLWSRPGVGRAGSASPNITVTPISDPVTGGVQAIQRINRDTGEVEWIDPISGEPVDPSQVQLGPGKEEIDIFVDDLMGDVLGSLSETDFATQ